MTTNTNNDVLSGSKSFQRMFKLNVVSSRTNTPTLVTNVPRATNSIQPNTTRRTSKNILMRITTTKAVYPHMIKIAPKHKNNTISHPGDHNHRDLYYAIGISLSGLLTITVVIILIIFIVKHKRAMRLRPSSSHYKIDENSRTYPRIEMDTGIFLISLFFTL